MVAPNWNAESNSNAHDAHHGSTGQSGAEALGQPDLPDRTAPTEHQPLAELRYYHLLGGGHTKYAHYKHCQSHQEGEE